MKFAIKTFGWAVISGGIFLASAVLAGSPFRAALVATVVCVVTKTPFYALLYEWAFHRVWPHDQPKAEPLEHFIQEEDDFLLPLKGE